MKSYLSLITSLVLASPLMAVAEVVAQEDRLNAKRAGDLLEKIKR